MREKLARLITSLLLPMLLLFMVTTPAAAIGLGVAPSVLTIQNAAPSQTYIRDIFVYNTSDAEQVFLLDGLGTIASWVTFYTMEDNTKPIAQLRIPANDRSNATVKFSIPADASPIVYRGQLMVTGEPPVAGDGARVQVQLPIEVVIQMVGAPDVVPEANAPTDAPVQKINSGELNLMSLSYEGKPAPGRVTKFQAILKNLTQTTATAYLAAEVYVGDQLVDTFKSDPLLVPAAGSGDVTLTAYYTFQKAGDYTIQSKVIYEGKQTQQNTLELKVAGSGAGAASMPLVAIIGIGVAVLLVIGLGLLFINRSRSHKVRTSLA